MWKKFAHRSRERKAQLEEQIVKQIGREAQNRLGKLLQDFQTNAACQHITHIGANEAEKQYVQILCKRLRLRYKMGRDNEIMIRKPSRFNLLSLSSASQTEMQRFFDNAPITSAERSFVWGKENGLAYAPGLALRAAAASPATKPVPIANTLNLRHTRSLPLPSPPVLESRKLLPSWAHREEILQKIAQSEVTIIQGATGSGKSTQAVQYVLDANHANGGVKILCTQPRRLAAMALATRVAKERGETQVGNTVGYSVRFDSNYSAERTRILFCTTGITLMSLRDGLKPGGILDGITHLFIDEVHERDRNADFLLIFIRELLLAQRAPTHVGPKLKLILMSATMSVNAFEHYFAGLTCANVEVEGRTFPVDAYFLDDIQKSKPQRNAALTPGMSSASKRGEVAAEVDHALILRLLEDISQGLYVSKHLEEEEGADREANACLVFLPGWGDIQDLTKLLSAHPRLGDASKFRVLPLHSGIPARDQMLVFARPPRGVQKIILSTNIAETSLTVEDVAYVIDSGLAKEKGYDANLRSSSLLPTLISQANAMQRRGRAGRCRPGVCLHLYTRAQFDAMAKFQIPELLRTPLDELCLNARAILRNNAGFFHASPSIEMFLGKALDAPPRESIRASIATLVAMGALDAKEQLTGLGTRLCALPVEPKLGKTVLYGAMLDALSPAITLSVASGFRDAFLFAVNPAEKHQLARAKQRLSTSIPDLLGPSDHASVLTAYREYAQKPSRYSKLAYCDQNFLSHHVLDSLQSMHAQVLDKLPAEFKSRQNIAAPAALSALIASVTFPNIALCRGKKLQCDPAHRGIKPHASSSVEIFRRPRGGGGEESYFVFEELVRGVGGCDLRVMTQLDALALVLFAGSLNVFSAKHAGDGFRLLPSQEESDLAHIGLNSWFSLALDRSSAEQLAVLRLRFETSFLNAMERGHFLEADRALGQTVLRVLAGQMQESKDSQEEEDEDSGRD